MIIIIIGNPVEGFEYFGPFDSIDQATDWGADLVQGDWWVTVVESPAAYDLNGDF